MPTISLKVTKTLGDAVSSLSICSLAREIAHCSGLFRGLPHAASGSVRGTQFPAASAQEPLQRIYCRWFKNVGHRIHGTESLHPSIENYSTPLCPCTAMDKLPTSSHL